MESVCSSLAQACDGRQAVSPSRGDDRHDGVVCPLLLKLAYLLPLVLVSTKYVGWLHQVWSNGTVLFVHAQLLLHQLMRTL